MVEHHIPAMWWMETEDLITVRTSVAAVDIKSQVLPGDSEVQWLQHVSNLLRHTDTWHMISQRPQQKQTHDQPTYSRIVFHYHVWHWFTIAGNFYSQWTITADIYFWAEQHFDEPWSAVNTTASILNSLIYVTQNSVSLWIFATNIIVYHHQIMASNSVYLQLQLDVIWLFNKYKAQQICL